MSPQYAVFISGNSTFDHSTENSSELFSNMWFKGRVYYKYHLFNAAFEISLWLVGKWESTRRRSLRQQIT